MAATIKPQKKKRYTQFLTDEESLIVATALVRSDPELTRKHYKLIQSVILALDNVRNWGY